MATDDPVPETEGDALTPELVVRLRARAEELRRTAPERGEYDEVDDEVEAPDPGADTVTPGPQVAEPEGAQPEVPEAEPLAPDPLRSVVAPDGPPAEADLIDRWGTEEHFETVSPRRNWAPVLAVAVVVVIVGLIYVGIRLVTDTDEVGRATSERGDDADAASVLDEPPPDLDDLTADVTIPPGPAEGLTVVDRGVSVVEDRFDPERREGTFAVVIENPHAGWLAQSVQVDVTLLDPDGVVVGTDTAFVEVVLPGQTVAVASHFFDATTAFVAGVEVALDVARWRETEPFEGGFVVADVLTEEAEFSGVRTTALLRSTFDRPLRDVGVTAVYRGAFGQIIGGYDTFLELVEPGVDTPVDIALLANVTLDQITSTEVYAHAGFGFVPDDG